MMRLVAGSLLALALMAAACSPRATPDDPDPENVVAGLGYIVYNDFEGGFYGLVADDGQRYNLTNLGEDFKQDSLRVRFRLVRLTDMVSTRMWGQNAEVLDMLPVTVDD